MCELREYGEFTAYISEDEFTRLKTGDDSVIADILNEGGPKHLKRCLQAMFTTAASGHAELTKQLAAASGIKSFGIDFDAIPEMYDHGAPVYGPRACSLDHDETPIEDAERFFPNLATGELHDASFEGDETPLIEWSNGEGLGANFEGVDSCSKLLREVIEGRYDDNFVDYFAKYFFDAHLNLFLNTSLADQLMATTEGRTLLSLIKHRDCTLETKNLSQMDKISTAWWSELEAEDRFSSVSVIYTVEMSPSIHFNLFHPEPDVAQKKILERFKAMEQLIHQLGLRDRTDDF